jgi:hypothetical protein
MTIEGLLVVIQRGAQHEVAAVGGIGAGQHLLREGGEVVGGAADEAQ